MSILRSASVRLPPKMRRLLVVTNDFPPRIGGIEEYISELIGRLESWSTTVLTSRHEAAEIFDRGFKGRVLRWGGYPLLPHPRLARAIVELVQREGFNVVLFGASVPLALMAGGIRRHTSVPLVMCTHGVEPGLATLPGGQLLLKRALEHAAVTTTLSNWAGRRLRQVLGARARIEVLPSGVDPEVFQPWTESPVTNPGPVVCCVGRLVPRKGQDRLIEALPIVSREFPGVRLQVIGGGPSRARLERLARRLGVANRVLFTGPVASEDLPALLASADVFAMPCRTRWLGADVEGLGTVFLQAAAMGKPVIAGRSGGAPEALIDGETGFVVDGRSPASVAAAILTLLRSPERAKAMGARGAARVHQQFAWPQLARRLESVLEEAADRGDGHR